MAFSARNCDPYGHGLTHGAGLWGAIHVQPLATIVPEKGGRAADLFWVTTSIVQILAPGRKNAWSKTTVDAHTWMSPDVMQDHIHNSQKGFIHNRQIPVNEVEIDTGLRWPSFGSPI